MLFLYMWEHVKKRSRIIRMRLRSYSPSLETFRRPTGTTARFAPRALASKGGEGNP